MNSLDDHADLGLGDSELGMARFTRPVERIEHHDDVVAATQRRLDATAERAWERMDSARDTDMFDMCRDLAFAAKDRADEYRRDHFVGADKVVDEEVLDARIRARMLDQAADLIHEVVAETPADDRHRDRLAALSRAVKAIADATRENSATDTVILGGTGADGESNHHKEIER